MNYNGEFIDNLFLEIGNMVTELGYKAQVNKNNLVNRFLDYVVNIIQSETEDEIIDMEIQYEINRICIKKDIEDEAVKCLFIIKSLAYAIVNREYEKILIFAKRYAGDETFKYLNYKLGDTVKEKVIFNN